jgi:hypothetical protein
MYISVRSILGHKWLTRPATVGFGADREDSMADWARAAADVFRPLPSLIVALGFSACVLAISSGVKDRLPIEGATGRGLLGCGGLVLIAVGIWLWRGERNTNGGPDKRKFNVKTPDRARGHRIGYVHVRCSADRRKRSCTSHMLGKVKRRPR